MSRTTQGSISNLWKNITPWLTQNKSQTVQLCSWLFILQYFKTMSAAIQMKYYKIKTVNLYHGPGKNVSRLKSANVHAHNMWTQVTERYQRMHKEPPHSWTAEKPHWPAASAVCPHTQLTSATLMGRFIISHAKNISWKRAVREYSWVCFCLKNPACSY